EVGIGLADAFQGDPLVRRAGSRRDGPLAPRDDVRPERARSALARQPLDDRSDVVRLDRVAPDPRVGEGRTELRGGFVQGDGVGDEARRPIPAGGLAQPRRQSGYRRPIALRPKFASPSSIDTTLITSDPRSAPMTASEVSPFAG